MTESNKVVEYRGLQLDRFQVEAISALQQQHSVLVSAPTGTGKTVVADWIVENEMAKGNSVVYTAPIKALSNQKYRDYCSLFGEENVGLVTGDLVVRRDAPCKVMTTEILRNMLICGDHIPNLAAVIIDEIHFLDDAERGTTWEEVLIYLPKEVLVVGLSATLSNIKDFAAWLSMVRDRQVTVVEEHKRAVPLSFRIATKGGICTLDQARHRARRKPKKKNDERKRRRGRPVVGHLDVFEMLGAQNQPYLYFVFSRAKTEDLAYSLGRHIREPLTTVEEEREIDRRLDLFFKKPGSEACLKHRLIRLYRSGIAFHHAGLHVMLKAFVEELYEARLLKVLYCTSTFALGINMPAKTAIFDSLMRYDGRGMIQLPTREFMQMAGRAGRRGLDKEGTVVIRMDPHEIDEWQPAIRGYLQAKYEAVHSRFSLSFNSVVHLLHRHPPDKIREIVEKSFLSWFRQKKSQRDFTFANKLESALQDERFAGGKSKKKRERKKVKRLRNQAEDLVNQTWAEFEERITFLQVYDYIDEDLSFQVGAKALMHFQIQEVLMAELFLEGVFEDMEKHLLFGVLCAMVVELPRGVRVAGIKKYRSIARPIIRILRSDVVQDAAELSRLPLVWDTAMIPIGMAWAEGKSLAEVLQLVDSETDISGTLVGAFRRAKDLGVQLRNAWKDFPDKVDMMKELLTLIGRDEVEVIA